MEQTESFPIPESVRHSRQVTDEEYRRLYDWSVREPEAFWAAQAEQELVWLKRWRTVLEWDFARGHVRWFSGGTLNVSANCLDRHIESRGNKIALIWEGNEPGEVRRYTYREVLEQVCRIANVLKAQGVRKEDRVAIYLPMVPEAMFSMLACARIGAVHSVVFAGFSAESLRDRIVDSGAKVLLTANEGLRGPKRIPLKHMADEAIDGLLSVERVLVVRRTDTDVPMRAGRDLFLEDEMRRAAPYCEPAEMDAEDPLFILYTSGSTGKPKGVLHTQAGYLLYVKLTHRYVFDLQESDTYFCAADIGWITGHSYIVYGPLANGATTVMFEATPQYPDAGRYWETVARHRANIFYTAPTAIRAIAKEGNQFVETHDRSSLRVLGSVGEPINRDAWLWYHKVVGEARCAVVDTWWQTETGGIMIAPIPGATPTKPGSATRPFFGVQPILVDEQGKELEGNGVKGRLCIKFPWPGLARTVYGDHQRFIDTYFSQYPGCYFTGDACERDADGYYWISGRVDDVLLVSGHRIGTAEIESAIVRSGVVAEAAVVGMPHDVKGVGIYVFAILNGSESSPEEARAMITRAAREHIGGIATPDVIQFVSGLPKTRSGKIMRRILRKIAEGERREFGDISTLAEPGVVEEIVRGAPKIQ